MAADGAGAAGRRAQDRVYSVNLSSDNPEAEARIGAFLQGLQEFGWSIGRNLRIEHRWASNLNDLPRRNQRYNWMKNRRSLSYPLPTTPKCRLLAHQQRTD